jgi:pilus assembly protein CpaC
MRYPISTAIRRLPAVAGFAILAACFAADTRVEELKLTVGRSAVIDYPADVARISTSNPEVVDAVAVSKREILLNAKTFGNSSVVVWSRTGGRTFFAVSVEPNLDPVRTLIRETLPGEAIEVRGTRDAIALSGKVSNAAMAERAMALVAPLAKTVVNNLQVHTEVERQIILRVRFAELNRSYGSSFGATLLSTGIGNTPGRITTGQFSAANPTSLKGVIPGQIQGTTSEFTLSDALNIFAFRPDLNLSALIRALQNQGVLEILAEPNLVTTDGKQASFLVGGEFPVPIVQGGASAGAVTIQFREFGIRLTFLPVTTPHGTIKMHVKPEVSTIDMANAVTFSGFTIPALATRRVETDIELGLGQSFVIGGLIDDRVTETVMKIPGLAHIPLLGAIFRSKNVNKAKTELVVMVTPEIAKPLEASDPKPGPKVPISFLPASENAPKQEAKHDKPERRR